MSDAIDRDEAVRLLDATFCDCAFDATVYPHRETCPKGVQTAIRALPTFQVPAPQACVEGKPIMHDGFRSRWCSTHNRLMLNCESHNIAPTPTVNSEGATHASWKCPKCGWWKVQSVACEQCHAWMKNITGVNSEGEAMPAKTTKGD